MEKMKFGEEQGRLLVSAGGKVLVLMNGHKVENGPTGENLEATTQWEYDGEWLDCDGYTDEGSLLRAAKRKVLDAIDAWDKGDEVNVFYVNGRASWLDKATRVGLVNSATMCKEAGEEKMPLWLGDKRYEIACDKVLGILRQIELYAMACYNATAQHRDAVESLDNAEGVLAYDYRDGYPDKVSIEL